MGRGNSGGDSADHVSADDPSAPDDASPYGYYVDSLGRRYPIVQLGCRNRQSSGPAEKVPLDWANMSPKPQLLLKDWRRSVTIAIRHLMRA